MCFTLNLVEPRWGKMGGYFGKTGKEFENYHGGGGADSVFGVCVLVIFSPPWDFCCQLLIGLRFTGHECVCKLPYEGRVAFVWIAVCG